MESKLIFSPNAQKDMDEITGYIRRKLKNPTAAQNTLRKIRKETQKLRRFPNMGTPLEQYGILEGYRYILCGSYLVFYRVENESVYIDRVMYGRRDYIRTLLGEDMPLF